MSQTLIMHKVRPFWGRVLVMDSVVDQEETASGIIVPVQDESSDLTRAIVVNHDPYYVVNPSMANYPQVELLPIGTVVWYARGRKVGDVVIIDVDDIWAFEAAD